MIDEGGISYQGIICILHRDSQAELNTLHVQWRMSTWAADIAGASDDAHGNTVLMLSMS